jgi:hypothetical protein
MAQAEKGLFQKRKTILQKRENFSYKETLLIKGSLKNLGTEVFFRKLSLRKK